MSDEEAKKMLKAKLECFKNETSGINHDCNMRLCDGCSLNYEQGNMGEQKEALDMAKKALEQRWIPVSERLPEDGQDVLICDIDGDIMIGYHVRGRLDTHFSQQGSHEHIKNVKAWMPLPEPYKAESEDEV